MRYATIFATAASWPPASSSTWATRPVVIGSPSQYSPGLMRMLVTEPSSQTSWVSRVTVSADGTTPPRSSASTASACPSPYAAPRKSPFAVHPGAGPDAQTFFSRSPSRSRPPKARGSPSVTAATSASRAAAAASGASSGPAG